VTPDGLDPRPGFTAQLVAGGVRQFTARADQPLISLLFLDCIRALPGSLGMVIVDLGEMPQEWVGGGLSRFQVLEGLLALRDLLGKPGMDVAVFSPSEGVEVFLDRSGSLEIRTGGSWEPRARSLLEHREFRWVSRLGPIAAVDAVPVAEETHQRIAAVSAFLNLRATGVTFGARHTS
jgi:hypothetical protein